MALGAAEVYRLSATDLRKQCAEVGLSSQGPVRSLQERLVRHFRGREVATKHKETDKGSMSDDEVSDPPRHVAGDSHGVSSDSPISVLTELLRQVPALASEDPEAILGLICKLDEYHALGLVEDRTFVVRALPKFTGAVLRFFGECLRNQEGWQSCKTKLLQEFFPLSEKG